MIDPKVREVIADALIGQVTENDEETVANIIIGALAATGFAIIQVDADTVRRVVAEMERDK